MPKTHNFKEGLKTMNNGRISTLGLAAAIAAAALAGCDTSSSSGKSNGKAAQRIASLPSLLLSSAKSVRGGLFAELYSSDSLSVGYDSLALVLEDSLGNIVTNAKVAWKPLEDHYTKSLDTIYGTHSANVDSTSFYSSARTDGTFRVGGLFAHSGYGSQYRIRVLIQDSRFGTAVADSVELITHLRTAVAKYHKALTFKAPAYSSGTRRVGVYFTNTPVQGSNAFYVYLGTKGMVDGVDPCINWPTDTVSWTVVGGAGLLTAKKSIIPADTLRSLGRGRFTGTANFPAAGVYSLALRFTNKGLWSLADSANWRDTTIYLDSIPVN